jgi:hypothetical protein
MNKIVKMLVELEVFGRVNRLETMCLFILVANLHWEFPFDERLNLDKFIFDWTAYDGYFQARMLRLQVGEDHGYIIAVELVSTDNGESLIVLMAHEEQNDDSSVSDI